MSDVQPGSSNPFDPTPTTPPESTPAPIADPMADLVRPAPKGPPIGKIVGISAGILLLVGGGAFAYTQFVKPKSNTPVQAVESFYTALANADMIGLAETLDPGERDIMLDSMVPMVAEMNRLEFFKDADLKKFQGISGSFTNYKATHKNLRDDLAEVTIQTGTLVTNFDPKALPLGKNIKDAFKDVLDTAEKTSTTTELKDTPFVVHKTGNKWYVSLNYSVAEENRRTENELGNPIAVPLKTAGTQAKGADTPEAAVAQMMQASADLNISRMIELVPPDELPALQNYSDTFLPSAEKNVAAASGQYKLTVTPKLRSESVGKDRAVVFVDDLPFNFSVDNDDVTIKVNYADSKVDAAVKTTAGDSFEGKYARGDFNMRLALSDGTKVTGKRVKKDFTGTFDGSDGSQGRANYTNGVFNGSVNLSDGTNGSATYRDGEFNGAINASDGTKGTANIKDDKINAALTFPDGSQTTVKFADECLTLSSGLDEQKACGKDEIINTFFGAAGSQLNDPRILGQFGLDRFFPSEKLAAEKQRTCARTLPRAKIGFTTVQRNGKWFVSPLRTTLDMITAQMKVLEPKDIDCLRTQFKSFGDQIQQQINATQTQIDSTFTDISNTLPPGNTDDPLTADPFAPDSIADPFASATDTVPSSSDVSGDDLAGMSDAEFEEFMKQFDTIPAIDTAASASSP